MTTVDVRLTLPDNLAREAEANGLLAPGVLEQMLREEIRRRQVGRLFAAADHLAALGSPPMTGAEVEAEILAARADKRADHARGG